MPERNQDVNPSRQQFYRHISAQNLTPLWSHCTICAANAECKLRSGLLELSGDSPTSSGQRRVDWRQRGGSPRAGAGKPDAARTVLHHPDVVCRIAVDHAG